MIIGGKTNDEFKGVLMGFTLGLVAICFMSGFSGFPAGGLPGASTRNALFSWRLSLPAW